MSAAEETKGNWAFLLLMEKCQQKMWIHLLEVCFISNVFVGLGKVPQVFLKFVVTI